MPRTPPHEAMAAGDEMPPAAAGQDAEAELAASAGRFREIIDILESKHKRFTEKLTELEANTDVLELTIARLQEDNKAAAEELQDARKALIEGLLKHKLIIKESSVIGIKMMGKLEETAFQYACMSKYRNADDDPEAKASVLFSAWQDVLKNPSWRPFKTVEVDGKTQEVVDEDGAMLMQLRKEYGDIVFSSVRVAVAELRGYNRAERYPVPELWNFDERRKATTAEALSCVFDHLK